MLIEEIIAATFDNEFISKKLNRLPSDFKKAKNLLNTLLELDPENRISAQ